MKKVPDSVIRAKLIECLPRLWRFAVSLTGRRDWADDLVQNTCVRALERQHQVTDVDGLLRWLMRIARTTWYNELRSKALRQTQSLDSGEVPHVPADIASQETNIFLREVLSEVMLLPEAQRATVMLVLIEGFSYREAADILDVPIGTVMSRLSAARGKLAHLKADPAGGTKPKGQKV